MSKNSSANYALVVGFAAIPVVFLCIALVGWETFFSMNPAYTKTPSLGYCTLDGHIIRCNKDLGGEPHHYIHHEYEVLEIMK